MENLDNNLPKKSISEFDTITCDHCGCTIFDNKYVLKRIPGILVGTGGEDIQYPVPVFVCSKCGTMLKEDREALENKMEKPIPQIIT